jgi:hypothetical protein
VREKLLQHNYTDVLIVEDLRGPGLDTLSIYRLVAGQTEQAASPAGRIAYVDINPAHNLAAMEFAEDVAVNRGLPVRVFPSIQEAEEWLEGGSEAWRVHGQPMK